MHRSALISGKKFFDKYVQSGTIVEIGSQEVVPAQGSLRQVASPNCKYIGLDCSAGIGVDIVTDDSYVLPLENNYADVVVSSSAFEHMELFWVMFLEMARVVKSGGYIYINSPSNGYVHRHPVDCWRFYPDAGNALTKWAVRNGYDLELVETYIGAPDEDIAHWEDWVSIWKKK